jgi:protein-S-isoprenylcysteine O-methyltransferase Ste14
MVVHDPALLARRMRAGPTAEHRPAQRIIATLSFGAIIAVVVLGGLDRRFGWSDVPAGVVLLGDLLVVLGLYVTLLVLRANTFAGASIEIAADQRVISTGPYAIVRHPMYAGALVMAAGIPLALGSWPGLALVAALVPVLVWRIRDEESMLRAELPGYAAYTARVRWRLLPGLW